MNKILVLARNHNTSFIKRLTNELKQGEYLLFNPWKDPINDDVLRCKGLLMRTTGIYEDSKDLDFVEAYCSHMPMANSLKAHKIFRSKKQQYLFFEDHQLPHLPWLDLQSSSLEVLTAFITQNSSEQYLIKPHRGQGGWGIRVMNEEDVIHWFHRAIDREFILQPFIDRAREVRLFFIKEWSQSLERVRAPGEAAANYTLQGEALKIDTLPECEGVLKQLQANISLHYGAIDFLITGKNAVILEVNLVPGIEQLEDITGLNVMKQLLEGLFAKFSCQFR